ncbi:excinulease of nucleotide excision repair, DNA damage recognition component [Candidatus Promineifilum breve]|uniref:UvrABC system protein B n=1 Tax=Candidatus Promineifilum breve TaxID=1806508 RepID=A0A160SZF6_9CHLR|nr:excinuclease ABC subunit UvrB [Candidatus Promineifilum breve]CUS02786.2 excinulease of nucleotide excision repair, DNA damage recognition component [Candidatus Promineifilum breve]
MTKFELVSDFVATGDQPQAIAELLEGMGRGDKFQTLLGATGTGKTFTIANIIQETQRPTIILAHNKTLAAQLYSEFREFFPRNAVSYFVSYYDYYQPEAYIPRHDLYIEKETQINDEIDRLRLQAMATLKSRRDVIIVASVSCIYGIGNPEAWGNVILEIERGGQYRRNTILRHLVDIQYDRNDTDLRRSTFRVRGDTLQIYPAYAETAFLIEFWGDVVERIAEFDPLTGEVLLEHTRVAIYPAREFITDEEKLSRAINDIESELTERIGQYKKENRLLEAQRIEQRVNFDLEMLREVGFTPGIENYSRHLDQRPAGSRPWTLLDYFPADYMMVIDESHMTLPQVRGMWGGDQSRKSILVDFGFRLPSAMDNRPLNFTEFESLLNQVIFTSATPGPFELEHSTQIAHQVIRPTGVVDPEVEVRPVRGQVDDLIGEVNRRIANGQRALVTTLTKRMAEDLSDYLLELGIKVHYLHSEVKTLERTEILRDLRLGVYDVVVGINLLREGLDLPEVSLVAILDADKEGFLRSETSLTQTIGRAARHVEGKVIMYADRMTDSMAAAIRTTNARRAVQVAYNTEHGIEPRSIIKAVHALTDELTAQREMARGGEAALAESRGGYVTAADLPKVELAKIISELEKQMKHAAQQLEFERAAVLRDQVMEMRQIMVLKDAGGKSDLPEWERMRRLDEAGLAYEVEN